MRALTLTQPWAGLVASGIKRVENRPRSMIKREDFGKPFAIHASRRIDRGAWPSIIAIAPETALDFPGPMAPSARIHRLAEITSAVIAVATIDSILDPRACGIDPDSEGAASPLPADQRRWWGGPIGYVLRDVQALETPIACRGYQAFWTLPAEVERKIVEQLRKP